MRSSACLLYILCSNSDLYSFYLWVGISGFSSSISISISSSSSGIISSGIWCNLRLTVTFFCVFPSQAFSLVVGVVPLDYIRRGQRRTLHTHFCQYLPLYSYIENLEMVEKY